VPDEAIQQVRRQCRPGVGKRGALWQLSGVPARAHECANDAQKHMLRQSGGEAGRDGREEGEMGKAQRAGWLLAVWRGLVGYACG